ncbi:hypothetical protein GJ744_000626 [Endocarpon pusillum]|uniref:Uncharacterized protein n=1 Tax=Endocarpon pusillum TaxID=364733 RepID=A0A8H7E168_9EURO|nr:hypothetical protein GJ744_000626 [Endocarpon pusillum]
MLTSETQSGAFNWRKMFVLGASTCKQQISHTAPFNALHPSTPPITSLNNTIFLQSTNRLIFDLSCRVVPRHQKFSALRRNQLHACPWHTPSSPLRTISQIICGRHP